MDIKCIKCNTRMVQHEAMYVCLLCEHEIEIEDWIELENVYLKREGAKLYDDV